jgi:hypothetical protein
LVDFPGLRALFSRNFLRNAQLAGVKQTQRTVDSMTNISVRLGVNIRAILKSGSD